MIQYPNVSDSSSSEEENQRNILLLMHRVALNKHYSKQNGFSQVRKTYSKKHPLIYLNENSPSTSAVENTVIVSSKGECPEELPAIQIEKCYTLHKENSEDAWDAIQNDGEFIITNTEDDIDNQTIENMDNNVGLSVDKNEHLSPDFGEFRSSDNFSQINEAIQSTNRGDNANKSSSPCDEHSHVSAVNVSYSNQHVPTGHPVFHRETNINRHIIKNPLPKIYRGLYSEKELRKYNLTYISDVLSINGRFHSVKQLYSVPVGGTYHFRGAIIDVFPRFDHIFDIFHLKCTECLSIYPMTLSLEERNSQLCGKLNDKGERLKCTLSNTITFKMKLCDPYLKDIDVIVTDDHAVKFFWNLSPPNLYKKLKEDQTLYKAVNTMCLYPGKLHKNSSVLHCKLTLSTVSDNRAEALSWCPKKPDYRVFRVVDTVLKCPCQFTKKVSEDYFDKKNVRHQVF
ncbi:hypothetical protein CHUAL_005411 [Chamberlinius hualienensis]